MNDNTVSIETDFLEFIKASGQASVLTEVQLSSLRGVFYAGAAHMLDRLGKKVLHARMPEENLRDITMTILLESIAIREYAIQYKAQQNALLNKK